MNITQPQSDSLLAGAAMVDISPDMGIQLAGDIGRHRPTEEIREPLNAHALVLEQGGRRFCILSLDLLAVTNEWVGELRNRAQQRFALEPDAVMVHVTQNHAAPTVGHFKVSKNESDLIPAEYPWLKGGDDRYNEPAIAGMLGGHAAKL